MIGIIIVIILLLLVAGWYMGYFGGETIQPPVDTDLKTSLVQTPAPKPVSVAQTPTNTTQASTPTVITPTTKTTSVPTVPAVAPAVEPLKSAVPTPTTQTTTAATPPKDVSAPTTPALAATPTVTISAPPPAVLTPKPTGALSAGCKKCPQADGYYWCPAGVVGGPTLVSSYRLPQYDPVDPPYTIGGEKYYFRESANDCK